MEPAIKRFETAPCASAEELRRIPVFSELQPDELEWLASKMTVVDAQPGELLFQVNTPADYMIVMLEGSIRAERDDGMVYSSTAGEVTGMLPFSRLTEFKVEARATMPIRVAALHKRFFTELGERIPLLEQKLVNVLADRIRSSTIAFEQREKLAALGKLSAGLAHELNNPAAAAQRASANMKAALLAVRKAVLKLDKGGLPDASRVFLAQMECDREEREANRHAPLDSLERSELEEEIAAWLQQEHVDRPWDLATTLVDLGFTVEMLKRVSDNVPGEFLEDVLIRLTAAFNISRLAGEIESSAHRISELVRSVKEYSYMDQMPVQNLDIHQGIENTLIMLQHKLKKGVEVSQDFDRSLPKVTGRGSELNQIWTNLIVNAIEAMGGRGKLTIRTSRDGRCARVEVIDNGPGIPEDIQKRIFEPFFTTKAVGEGTGLGLDTVYRVARNHNGDVTFQSKPGETRFIVRIPFDLERSSAA